MDDVFQIADWKKVSDLGSGAFGVVSLWRNIITNDYIAIKKCKFHLSSNLTAKQKERWRKEVEIMKMIKHQNIVSYLEIPMELQEGLLKKNPTKLPLLSMEYCQKGNLRHLLQKPKNISGLEEKDIRWILLDITGGLKYLHNLNITHRDIKPDNIVLQQCNIRASNTIYKIIDLGYAKELNDSVVSFVGTLHYLAPEIFETIKYDKSVDYWSLGIMTFEIICGVVPFLPHQSPAERFIEIKRKKHSDISIYQNYSGQIIYSSELKRENFLSTCFKKYIEEWLQHILQIDPIERAKKFLNGSTTFQYLEQIVNKKIVQAFVLNRLEVLSYEINHDTSLGNFKEFIARDLEISKSDIILLFNNEFSPPDNDLVERVVENVDYIFIINRNKLLDYPTTYNFPKLIREVMRSALEFNRSYLWQLYAQTVNYITKERLTANLFRCGLQLYVGYLKRLAEQVRKKYISVSKKLGNLLVRVDCCTFIRKHNICYKNLCENEKYMNCLIYIGRLLDSFQKNLDYYRDFKTKIDKTFKRLSMLIGIWPKIVELVNNYNLYVPYERVMHLLEKTEKGKNVTLFKNEITDVVSKSILLKENLLKDLTFKAFLRGMANVNRNIEYILLWLQDYEKNIVNLSQIYMKNEALYWKMRTRPTKVSSGNAVLNLADSLSSLGGCEIMDENFSLINKFEKLLSGSIAEEIDTSVDSIV